MLQLACGRRHRSRRRAGERDYRSVQLALVTAKPLPHTPASLREDCLAKVFLSYSREDAPAAKQLAECIGRAGPPGLVGSPDRGRIAVRRRDRPRAQGCRCRCRHLDAGVDRIRLGAGRGRGRSRHRPARSGDRSTRTSRRLASANSNRSTSAAGMVRRSAGARRLDPRNCAEGRRQRPSCACGRPAPTSKGRIREQSVCVLPFVNMSGDPEQEYFSDGITEDIITDLSKVSALSVVARNTAFTFKGQTIDVKEVAQALRRRPRARRQRAQGGQPRADHCPAHRRRRRATTFGPNATTATSPTSSPSRTRFRRPSSRALRVKLLPEEERRSRVAGPTASKPTIFI